MSGVGGTGPGLWYEVHCSASQAATRAGTRVRLANSPLACHVCPMYALAPEGMKGEGTIIERYPVMNLSHHVLLMRAIWGPDLAASPQPAVCSACSAWIT